MQRRLLCPYCFRYFSLEESHWRCANAACRDPKGPANALPGEPDTVYAAFLRDSGVTTSTGASNRLLHSFAPSQKSPWLASALGLGGKGRMANCDWCQKPTPKRLCPHCHNDLPYTVSTVDSHVIAVIGAKEVGKSHYIAVLIEQLRQQVGINFGVSLLALNDTTTTRYQSEFYRPLYSRKRQLDASQAIDITPLMYRLRFANEGNPLKKHRSVSLVFFDNAGENFDAEDAMSTRARYLVHASAIIMLVDPFQMGEVRGRLAGSGCPLPREWTEPYDILERVIRQFQTFGNVGAQSTIKVPLAVAFTKADLMRDFGLLPKGNAAYSQPRHQGVLNRSVFRQVHDETRAALMNWGGLSLDNTLSQYFSDYAYCCVSSLGEAPAADGSLATVAPFRVEDPFIWALSRLGFVRTQ